MTPNTGTTYPARLTGVLDPNLSRWLWLVKWFLAIPHYVVLAFLWFAFAVTTIDRRLRHPLHRPLSALALRLQRRRAALDLAGRVLRLRRTRHRPLPALHPGPDRLPGRLRRRLSRAPLARPGPGQVLAAGHPAPDHRRAASPPTSPTGGPHGATGPPATRAAAGISLLGLLVVIAGCRPAVHPDATRQRCSTSSSASTAGSTA